MKSDRDGQPASETDHRESRQGELRRVLGPFSATCIVIGAIVGVGIFFNPSQVARLAGSGETALFAWILGGLIALCGALTFAALGSIYHGPGAQYEVLRDAWGPLPAFLFVFCNATAIQTGATAIIAIITIENLSLALSGQAASGVWLTGLATALILALSFANCLGARCGAGIQNATVFAKLTVLIAIASVAALQPGGLTEFQPIWHQQSATAPSAVIQAGSTAVAPTNGGTSPWIAIVFAAMVPAFFAYGGWQHALWISGEVRNPRRNVPLSILLGTLVVVAVYVLVNWAYLRLLGYAGVADAKTLAAEAVGSVFGDVGRRVIAGGVAISALGVLNAQLLSGPRLVYRLATDGRFFSLFGQIGGPGGAPIAAILLIGLIAVGLVVAAGKDKTDALTSGVVSLDGVFFVLTGIALFVLRKKREAEGTPWPGYGFPVVPAIFVLGEIGLVLGSFATADSRKAAILGLAWVGLAAGVYFAFFGRRDRHRDASRGK